MNTRKSCPLSDTWYYPFCSHYHDHELMGKLYDCPGRIACQNFKHMLDIHEKQLTMFMSVVSPQNRQNNPPVTTKKTSKQPTRKNRRSN